MKTTPSQHACCTLSQYLSENDRHLKKKEKQGRKWKRKRRQATTTTTASLLQGKRKNKQANGKNNVCIGRLAAIYFSASFSIVCLLYIYENGSEACDALFFSGLCGQLVTVFRQWIVAVGVWPVSSLCPHLGEKDGRKEGHGGQCGWRRSLVAQLLMGQEGRRRY